MIPQRSDFLLPAQKKYGSVVRMGTHCELNGFVIQNGNAQHDPLRNGGGVWADDSCVVANCVITGNTAQVSGGGLYAKGKVLIINSTIEGNKAEKSGDDLFGNCTRLYAGGGFSGSGTIETPTVITVIKTDTVIKISADTVWITIYQPKEIAGCVNNTFGFGALTWGGNADIETKTHTIIGTVDGKSVTQVWSGHVAATGCGTASAFDAGSTGSYKSVCAKNSSVAYGDLFSWCAVACYANILCPAPWRVPTKDDFIALDKALGGTGKDRRAIAANDAVLLKYEATSGTAGQFWGGPYSGYVNYNNNRTLNSGTYAYYWSQTNHSADNAYCFDRAKSSSSYISPQNGLQKYRGFALRCVR